MTRTAPFLLSTLCLLACNDGPGAADMSAANDQAAPPDLSAPAEDGAAGDLTGRRPLGFFISSDKGSANLGGLAGADARCKRLAEAAGAQGRRWAAYLSTYATAGQPAVNARDRIGRGPWYNAKGELVAQSVDELHQDMMMTLTKTTGVDERGQVVPGRGDTPNEHDILTGSTADGRVDGMNTCVNWTSDADVAGVVATVGHFDRQGGGAAPTSWNAAHPSRGCAAPTLVSTGGAGRIYCFATD